MSPSVTLLYAALLGLVGFVLIFMVGQARGHAKVSLNDGNDKALTEAVRRHANWAETVPYVLILMTLVEINGAPKPWLHGLGLVLLASRIVHPFGIDAAAMMKPARVVGMAGTLIVMLALIGIALFQVVAPQALAP